jgi:uncharacterized tellurite resistance protein B-like protein
VLYDNMSKTLSHLGLNDSNYRVLKLLPLVYVAWADGKISEPEERRLVALAHEHFEIGKRGEELLRGWLSERPSPAYFREGLHDLLLLAHAPDEWGVDVDELQGLLVHSEEIARASGKVIGAPLSVDKSEQQALRDIAKELGVDDGESWAELLEELS